MIVNNTSTVNSNSYIQGAHNDKEMKKRETKTTSMFIKLLDNKTKI